MSKRALKQRLVTAQNGIDALDGTTLPADLSLIDNHRRLPKAKGGIYTDENTSAVNPRAHMERHGTLRERPVTLDTIKALFDDRVQIMKLALKINNQLLAYERRTDTPHPDTAAFLEAHLKPVSDRLAAIDHELAKAIRRYDDPLARAALAVHGIGPVTVAALTAYIDFTKQVCRACGRPVGHKECPHQPQELRSATEHASSLWRYVGLDKPSHDRYSKGVAGGGNKTHRTVLWNTAVSMMKDTDNPYRLVYDRVKERLAASERETQTRNTQGRLVTLAWKDAKPSHRHGAALRAIMKHLLADYWFVGRTLHSLPTEPLYAESMLGHTHIVDPTSRGWKW